MRCYQIPRVEAFVYERVLNSINDSQFKFLFIVISNDKFTLKICKMTTFMELYLSNLVTVKHINVLLVRNIENR